MKKKIIFLAGLIFVGGFLATLQAQEAVELDVREYVTKLHRDAEKAEEWLVAAQTREEKTKTSELQKRLVELKGLLSFFDGMIAAAPAAFDETAFASANNRFNRTFNEAGLIARLDEPALAEMKRVDDEALLNASAMPSEGIYTSERLSYESDASAQNAEQF